VSKIKAGLREDIDVTDVREPVLPDEPTKEDFYMAELERICAELSMNIPYGYETELTGLIRVLENVLQHVRKPF
jgi:hypothetical protein